MSAAGQEELSEKIARLLSSPDGMEKIQSAMAALGQMSDSVPAEAPPVASSPAPAAAPASESGSELAGLTKLLPLLGSLNRDSDDTRLLQALRPYLHGRREQRLDEAMQLLRLSQLAPLLQGQVLLSHKEGGKKHG